MKMSRFDHELYNHCYESVASKRYWENRDFNARFDREVAALFNKIQKLLKL